MRIIAGLAKGRRLFAPKSLDIRPTGDRTRENLFNILMPRICGARFLDLFCGSGANGIEALSRGADHATFIDKDAAALRITRRNLELCRLSVDSVIVKASIPEQLERQPQPFDIIFADPPYAYQGYELLLTTLLDKGFLDENGVAIMETSHKTVLPDSVGALRQQQCRRYGDTALAFYA